MSGGAEADLRAVLSTTVPGKPPSGRPVSLDDPQLRAVVRLADRYRVTGYIQQAVETGWLEVSTEGAVWLADHHVDWCSSVLALERELLRVAKILQDASIEVVVLKGSAAAHLHHPDPGYRLFGDNDLLVRGEDLERAIALLRSAGYQRPRQPARPDFDRRFGKGATLRGPEALELDLHRNLVFGSFGFLIDLDELWSRTTEFNLGGRRLRALDVEARLLHGCYHAALGDPEPHLGSLRDLAEQLGRGDHDPVEMRSLMQRWGAASVVQRALDLLKVELSLDLASSSLAEGLAAHQPSRRDRRAIASYVSPRRSYTAKILATLPFLPRLRDRGALLVAAALPSKEFRRSRRTSGLGWWRRGLRSLRKGLLR